MGFDRVKMKQICQIIVLCAILILGIIYIKEFLGMLKVIFRILLPFIIGGVIAFVLNIPLCAIEKRLLGKWKGKYADQFKRPVGILLSIVFVLLVLFIVVISVVPQLTNTFAELGRKVPPAVNDLVQRLDELSVKYPRVETYIAEIRNFQFDWNTISKNVITFLKSGVSNMFTSTFSVASSIFGGIANTLIGFIFALYILGQKETISRALMNMMKAYLKPQDNARILKVCNLLYVNFVNFITGQCVEALILGSMFGVGMLICRLPYALLVGVLIAFTSLIPIVGAFIGCAVGVFLVLVDAPSKAILFLVLFLVLQQIEGNLIYPKVVGNKVGLPPILVLMAVTVGGGALGIAGMLVFIPIVSTIYTLVRENVEYKIGGEET